MSVTPAATQQPDSIGILGREHDCMFLESPVCFRVSAALLITLGNWIVLMRVDIQCMQKLPSRHMNENALIKIVRYMAMPAISDERVIIEGPQSICVKLKCKWPDGTESLFFIPSEFLERLVALIPAPKSHTTRYYGVLANENASHGHSFSNAHSTSMSSSAIGAADT